MEYLLWLNKITKMMTEQMPMIMNAVFGVIGGAVYDIKYNERIMPCYADTAEIHIVSHTLPVRDKK
jgi:hypothetical protein